MTATLLEHVGVPYDDPESLVESIGPRVADALADGDDVYLSVDRRTARGFREWLGSAGDAVAFPSPSVWPQDIVRDLRSVMRPERRTLVLGQYTAAGIDGREMAQVEDGVNLVMSDVPLTLLCTCASQASPSLGSSLRFGHPLLWVDGVAVPNPDYRVPPAWRPVTGALWGPPTLRLDFRTPVDLHRLREHVSRAAREVGLSTEVVREAVLATHEAALLAAGGVPPTGWDPAGAGRVGEPDGDAAATVPCVLEVRAAAGALHCEILGPRPDPATGGGDDPLHIVRMFCDSALLHDEADVRAVRVLRTVTGTRSPAA
jgi:hypothetical protein